MGYAQTTMDEISEYGRELAILSFAGISFWTAELLHSYAHTFYGTGTPMDEILFVSVVMAAYAGIGYLLTVALQAPDYIPAIGGLGVGSAFAIHYASHTVAGFQVPGVGNIMGFTFAIGYLVGYLYLGD